MSNSTSDNNFATSIDDSIDRCEHKLGIKLSEEQRAAVHHMTMQVGVVAHLAGHAGIGMTTVHQLCADRREEAVRRSVTGVR